jgi:hypothetical protein
VPLYGDGRSGTFSATVTQYGGYKNPISPTTVPDGGASRLLSQPSPPPSGSASISFVGSAQAGAGSGSSVTPPTVAGVTAGDLIICAVNGSSGTITGFGEVSYTGWTIVEDMNVTTLFSRILTRVADGTSADSPPTVTLTGNGVSACATAVYRGVDTTVPLSTESGTTWTSSNANPSAPAQSNADGNSWGIAIIAMRQVISPVTWTPGSGLTERVDVEAGASTTNNTSMMLADTDGVIASGSYTFSGTPSTAAPRGTAWAGVLKPSAGSTGTPATASGGITLGGSATAEAALSGAGSITLGGTATAAAQATASGSITLGGTATAAAQATTSGSVTLGGTATARAVASSAGSITLGGTATAAGGGGASASGSVTLGGSATTAAPAAATGTVTLAGSATARAPTSAAGTVVLGGTVTARAPVTSSGTVVLGGTVTSRAVATSAGSVTLGGTTTVGTAVVPPHVYVTAVLSYTPSTAVLAGNGVGTATLDPQVFATAAVTPVAAGTAVLASDGVGTATLASNGVGTSTVSESYALAEIQLT